MMTANDMEGEGKIGQPKVPLPSFLSSLSVSHRGKVLVGPTQMKNQKKTIEFVWCIFHCFHEKLSAQRSRGYQIETT
jgi:hypothetical protein